jgi:hypothetical protein
MSLVGQTAMAGKTKQPKAAQAGAKVDVCHIPPDDPASFRTIAVKEKVVPKHLDHGDLLGPCEDQPAPTFCEPDPDCDADTHLRSTFEVIDDLHWDIAMEAWAAYGCNFAPGAVQINEQGLCVGRADIISSAESKLAAFDAPAVISDSLIHEGLVREHYTQIGNGLGIADGVAIYWIECGQIQRFVDHGFIGLAQDP